MTKIFLPLLVILLLTSTLHAAQSTITEVEGYSCMGEDKTKKQTKSEAFTDAKRKALERTASRIKSETKLNNLELEKDIVEAYSQADVKILESKELGWYNETGSGECFKVWIKAEVIPDEKAMEKVSEDKQIADNPSAPLHVKVWTDKQDYKTGEKIKIYIKSNKPFYARILYKDAKGELLQLLPNPFRYDNYFNGGTVYEIPSGNDKFDLEVSEPFGEENVVVYASTSQLGDIDLENAESVYQVKTKAKDVGERTRGVKLSAKKDGNNNAPAEFFEDKVVLKTGK